MADMPAKQKSQMRALYIQTFSKQAQVEGEPAWANPFHSQIFGIYVLGELNSQPAALVLVPGQKLELPGVDLVCCPTEAEMLNRFWTLFKSGPPENLVTYNGRRHTIPCLYWRSALHGVEIANPDLLHDRYKPGPHVDLADVLTYHGLLRIPALAVLASQLNIPMPSLQEGDAIQQMISAALAAPNPAMLQMLARNGVEYAGVIARLCAHWRKQLNKTAYR
jgi:hypothetical protein